MIEKNAIREVRMIDVDCVDVLNPRRRNERAFADVVNSIRRVGLKKPITVTPRPSEDGAMRYGLVCGEGRLRAFMRIGEKRIPAMIVEATDEDAFLMSLVENVARRKHHPLELLAGIEQLWERGHSAKAISEKTGLPVTYTQGLVTMLKKGEERLLVAVERGLIPLNAALSILSAGDDDVAVQRELQDAYERGTLRGRRLAEARKIINQRRALGASITNGQVNNRLPYKGETIVRTYQKEVERQKVFVRKADFTQGQILMVIGAFRQLLADDHFMTLLRAEGLDTMPRILAERAGLSRAMA